MYNFDYGIYMAEKKMFSSLASLTVGAVAGAALVLAPTTALAKPFSNANAIGAFGCSGEGGCGGDKGCGGEGEGDGDKSCKGEGSCSGDKGCGGKGDGDKSCKGEGSCNGKH